MITSIVNLIAERSIMTVPCPITNDIGSRKIGLILFLIDSIPIIGNIIINVNAKNNIQSFVIVPAKPNRNAFGFS